MRFVVLKDKIIEALGVAQKAISGRNAVPTLNGIKLELNANGLYLTGTDNYITIVTKLPLKDEEGNDIVTVFEPGSVLISSRNIIDILRGMEDNEINFELVEENVVKITDSSSDFSLNCMDASDYPFIDLHTQGEEFTLDCKVLNSAINETAFAAADKDGRPVLTGVNLKAVGNKIEFVATDIFRVAKKNIEVPVMLNFNTTIPAKTLVEVESIGQNEKEVKITVNDKKTVFKFENTVVIARVINGMYPDTSKIVTNNFTSFLSVKSSNIVSAIDRVSKISSSKQEPIRLSLSTYRTEVSTRSQEGGSAKVSLTFESYNGNQLDISFMARYVLDAVKALASEEVEFQFSGDSSLFIIKKPGDNSSLQFIMPSRTY